MLACSKTWNNLNTKKRERNAYDTNLVEKKTKQTSAETEIIWKFSNHHGMKIRYNIGTILWNYLAEYENVFLLQMASFFAEQ